MIDKKYERVLFSLFMSAFMSGFMSLVVTFINMGLVENLIYMWLDAYWRAFLIAFPTIFVVVPQVRRVVGLLIKQ
jgi:hypothetical protein